MFKSKLWAIRVLHLPTKQQQKAFRGSFFLHCSRHSWSWRLRLTKADRIARCIRWVSRALPLLLLTHPCQTQDGCRRVYVVAILRNLGGANIFVRLFSTLGVCHAWGRGTFILGRRQLLETHHVFSNLNPTHGIESMPTPTTGKRANTESRDACSLDSKDDELPVDSLTRINNCVGV